MSRSSTRSRKHRVGEYLEIVRMVLDDHRRPNDLEGERVTLEVLVEEPAGRGTRETAGQHDRAGDLDPDRRRAEDEPNETDVPADISEGFEGSDSREDVVAEVEAMRVAEVLRQLPEDQTLDVKDLI